mmetsp:Transcript_3348/g.8076  ORF Transcript_3348/g.8076 Transcript_3348/m.8076 type:complete len:217 (+) Transcript_3348:2519-3169(+)
MNRLEDEIGVPVLVRSTSQVEIKISNDILVMSDKVQTVRPDSADIGIGQVRTQLGLNITFSRDKSGIIAVPRFENLELERGKEPQGFLRCLQRLGVLVHRPAPEPGVRTALRACRMSRDARVRRAIAEVVCLTIEYVERLNAPFRPPVVDLPDDVCEIDHENCFLQQEVELRLVQVLVDYRHRRDPPNPPPHPLERCDSIGVVDVNLSHVVHNHSS